MASGKQIAANRENALTNGLFTTGNYVRPEERDEYNRHVAEFQASLAPEGIVEQTFITEITGAAWRLRRCRLVEAAPASSEAEQKSIDRARASAHNTLRRAMAELRRLQTERQIRNQIYPAGTDLSGLGLSGTRDIIAARNNQQRGRLLAEQVGNSSPEMSVVHKACSPPPPPGDSFCKSPEPAAKPTPPTPIATPRSAPCPCGSGEKYKRCCGRQAPPVLGKAA